jgi:NAD(P)-dependent dehydrogenase (short-subunit alcohol dehydrogenase family)
MVFAGFQDKKVLVTGAGSGIGQAASLALIRSGACVTVREPAFVVVNACYRGCFIHYPK